MAFGLEGISLITIIQSVLLVISALLIIIAAIGILRMDKDMPNVVYARIHILGMVDVAGIIAFIALGQPLFALIYLFLAPLLAHALANAYYHGEDDYNNPVINPDLLIDDPYNLNKDSDSDSDSDNSSDEVSVSDSDSDSDNSSDEVSVSDSDSDSDESSDSEDDSASEEDSDLKDENNETAESGEENLKDGEGDDND